MLELRDIHARYGAVRVLHGISLDVKQGELIAVVGANGAGKSTTLSTIAGVVKPSAGEIVLKGETITGQTPETIVRKGIAMVPENRDIFSALTVEQNLRLGAYIRGDRAEYLGDLAQMFDLFPILADRRGQAAGTMSGGEQQQLAIARALMSHPQLLIFDEPSLGLSPKLVDQVFALVQKLHKEGMTILLVEQNVAQALNIADRAYLIRMGKVEAEGTPQELRRTVDVESAYLGAETAHAASGGES